MAVFCRVEFDLSSALKPCSEATIGRDGFDERQVAIGNAQRLVGSSELDTVAR